MENWVMATVLPRNTLKSYKGRCLAKLVKNYIFIYCIFCDNKTWDTTFLSLSVAGCCLCVCWIQTQCCCDFRRRALHVGRGGLWKTWYKPHFDVLSWIRAKVSRGKKFFSVEFALKKCFVIMSVILMKVTVTARVVVCQHS